MLTLQSWWWWRWRRRLPEKILNMMNDVTVTELATRQVLDCSVRLRTVSYSGQNSKDGTI